MADIHIRNVMRHDEYAEQLDNLVSKCKEIAKPFEKEEVRIVISGDLVHQKNLISNELFVFASAFIRSLEAIANVVVITGNHDLIVNNTTRIDTMTALFETANFKNATFVDKLLGYQSGCVTDDNVTWALYSIYDGFVCPDIKAAREQYPDNKVIGLFHDSVTGASLFNGTKMDCGVDGSVFSDCDIVMAGHIHKRQEIKKGDTIILYPGSPIQQDYGETVTQHGFAVWNIEDMTYEFVDLPTEWGLYKFSINGENDIDENTERVENF